MLVQLITPFVFVAGDGHVVNDKRFLGPTLDVTTDAGNVR